VGIVGRGRGIVLRPRLPTDGGPRAPLSRTDGRQPFIAFARRSEEEGPWVGRQGGQPDGLGRGTSSDLRAFGRVRGLEHERPRHRGERQVERHVDEDRQNEPPPVPHSPILTHAPALTASRSSGMHWSPTQCFLGSKCPPLRARDTPSLLSRPSAHCSKGRCSASRVGSLLPEHGRPELDT